MTPQENYFPIYYLEHSLTQGDNHQRHFMAEDGESFVTLRYNMHHKLNWYIANLSVSERERQKGRANDMLKMCEDLAKKGGAFTLYAMVPDIWVRDWFLRKGYQVENSAWSYLLRKSLV